MNKIMTATIASLALLTACGGDSGGSGDQGKVADAMVETAKAEGIELDRDCVETIAAKLNDDDASAILASLDSDEEPDVSAEADQLAEEMFSCIEPGALVDQMMESIGDQPGVDKDCVREVFEGLSNDDIASIAETEGDLSSDVMSKLMEDVLPCMGTGG